MTFGWPKPSSNYVVIVAGNLQSRGRWTRYGFPGKRGCRG